MADRIFPAGYAGRPRERAALPSTPFMGENFQDDGWGGFAEGQGEFESYADASFDPEAPDQFFEGEEEFGAFAGEREWGLEEVSFPSGVALFGETGPGTSGSEFFDPGRSDNPLLPINRKTRNLKFSRNFRVKEFAKIRGRYFKKARIDPKLVEALQPLRDHLGKSIKIVSAYQSHRYRKRRKLDLTSPHLRARAAVIRVRGMSGLELAKAYIWSSKSCFIGVWAGKRSMRLSVEAEDFTFGAYFRSRKRNFHARHEIKKQYRLKCELPKEIGKALDAGELTNAVRLPIHFGIRDENTLTNMIFFPRWWKHHRKLKRGDKPQIKKWLSLRNNIVRPSLAKPSPPVAQAGRNLPLQGGTGSCRRTARCAGDRHYRPVRCLCHEQPQDKRLHTGHQPGGKAYRVFRRQRGKAGQQVHQGLLPHAGGAPGQPHLHPLRTHLSLYAFKAYPETGRAEHRLAVQGLNRL